MALISIKCFKSYNYFLVYWALDLISSIIEYLFEKKVNKDSNNDRKRNDYLNLLILNAADLLAGILVLITKYRMKSEKEKKEVKVSNEKYELIYNDLSIKENKGILVFLMSIIDLIGRSSTLIYHLIYPNCPTIDHSELAWLISIDIIFRIFFMKIILKIDLHKHHKFSILLLIIGFLPMSIKGFYDLEKSGVLSSLIFLIPRNILFPLGDTISKILLTNKFVLPQNLMFLKGVLNFSMHLIILPALILTKKIKFKDDDGNIYFSEFKPLSIIVIIINILSKFLKGVCIMKIIDIFTPQHVCLVNVVSALIIFLQYYILDPTYSFLIYIYIIAFIIVICATLLFTEILVINACELSKYTKVEIIEREKKEILELDSSVCQSNDITKDENDDENSSAIIN